MSAMLPAEFADLEPFASTWCLADEPARWERRLASTMAELRAFYDACYPRVEEAITYCDKFDLDELPADASNLLNLLCSFALVSYPIEVWDSPVPLHTGNARIDRIREPRH
ncbi:MAG TPA: hypothetical protein VHE57_04750 [Mycobacteriales bacterium]|nr:hypothetical protein [Mycobacteriales bacterium]